MNIKITREMYELFPSDLRKALDISDHHWNYGEYRAVERNVKKLDQKQREAMRDVALANQGVRGQSLIIRDLRIFERTQENSKAVRSRTCAHFTPLVIEDLKKVDGHRLYKKDESAGTYRAFYVTGIHYYPREVRGRGRDRYVIPEHTNMYMVYQELGVVHNQSLSFHNEDVQGRTAEQTMNEEGYYYETPELRATYLKEIAHYEDLLGKIGVQCLAVGVGETETSRSRNHWEREQTSRIQLDKDGEPTRVVVDVFHEGDAPDRMDKDTDRKLKERFWENQMGTGDPDDLDEDEDDMGEDDEDYVPPPSKEPEIPIYPTLMIFDLKRQLRMEVHVAQLTVYKYNTSLGDDLVLPKSHADFVDMLLKHNGTFSDIVGGKGGGAITLLVGPPGTGKTLTAEVFSEARERPLYSVQCSQLGMEPNELESALLKTFARAQRWRAILLLDEADVYIRSRGDDLQQNAIVGVFLRVLEYYKGVMFLTTNRSDLVDDAIVSRCIARIKYDVPEKNLQARLWKVLSRYILGKQLDDKVITELLTFDNLKLLSGRDVKGLLKLVKLASEAQNVPVTASLIDFVSDFRPTAELDPYAHNPQKG